MNNIRLSFRIIAMLCLALQISATAKTVRLSFLQDLKIGKKVAILHDRHHVHTNTHHLDSGEDAEKEIQLHQLNEIKDIFKGLESDSSSVLCVAEILKISEEEKKMIQQGLFQRPKLGTVLEGITEYIERNKAFHRNLLFKECNERHFFDSLHVNLLVNRDLAKSNRELNDQWQKEGDKPFYVLTGPEVGVFLPFVDRRRNNLSNRVNQLAIPEEAKKDLIKDIQDNFKNVYTIGKTIIDRSDNLDLNSTMLDCFLAAKDHELLSLTSAIASESSNAFDIPLLEEVIKSKEKRVVVCVGDYHASLLAKRLVDSGLEMVPSEASMPLEDFKDIEDFASKELPTKVPANITDIVLSFFRESPMLDTVEVRWNPL